MTILKVLIVDIDYLSGNSGQRLRELRMALRYLKKLYINHKSHEVHIVFDDHHAADAQIAKNAVLAMAGQPFPIPVQVMEYLHSKGIDALRSALSDMFHASEDEGIVFDRRREQYDIPYALYGIRAKSPQRRTELMHRALSTLLGSAHVPLASIAPSFTKRLQFPTISMHGGSCGNGQMIGHQLPSQRPTLASITTTTKALNANAPIWQPLSKTKWNPMMTLTTLTKKAAKQHPSSSSLWLDNWQQASTPQKKNSTTSTQWCSSSPAALDSCFADEDDDTFTAVIAPRSAAVAAAADCVIAPPAVVRPPIQPGQSYDMFGSSPSTTCIEKLLLPSLALGIPTSSTPLVETAEVVVELSLSHSDGLCSKFMRRWLQRHSNMDDLCRRLQFCLSARDGVNVVDEEFVRITPCSNQHVALSNQSTTISVVLSSTSLHLHQRRVEAITAMLQRCMRTMLIPLDQRVSPSGIEALCSKHRVSSLLDGSCDPLPCDEDDSTWPMHVNIMGTSENLAAFCFDVNHFVAP